MVVRAVHLELVKDMSAETFLFALRRFIGRGGKPARILSDNAPTFVLSRTVLKSVYGSINTANAVVSYLSNEGIE